MLGISELIQTADFHNLFKSIFVQHFFSSFFLWILVMILSHQFITRALACVCMCVRACVCARAPMLRDCRIALYACLSVCQPVCLSVSPTQRATA